MAITRKPGPAQTISLIGQLPEFPAEIPEKMTDRFPELSTWQGQMEKWWQRFSDMIQRDLDQIQGQFQRDESSTKTSLDAITAQITAINAQIDQILTGGGSDLQTQIDALSNRIQALLGLLTAHINNPITHQTISPIVGTQDVQSLDNKTIGASVPGYGRFSPLVGVGLIQPTQDITIGPTDYMVVAGTFRIFGNLRVEGTFAAV